MNWVADFLGAVREMSKSGWIPPEFPFSTSQPEKRMVFRERGRDLFLFVPCSTPVLKEWEAPVSPLEEPALRP